MLALGAVLAIVAGCGNGSSGNGKLLNARQATDLKGTLAQVEQDVAAKNCTSAAQQAASFEQQIDSIQSLDRRLRSALRASSRRLQTLVADNCQSTSAPTQTTTTPTTGDTGPTGPQGKVKKEKKSGGEKAPKQNGNPTPPGQGGQPPPGHQDGGGGAGVPGESGGNGTQSP